MKKTKKIIFIITCCAFLFTVIEQTDYSVQPLEHFVIDTEKS